MTRIEEKSADPQKKADPMDVVSKALALNEKLFAFTTAPTFAEFLNTRPAIGGHILRRYDEVRIPAGDQLFLADYPDPLRAILLVSEETPDTIVVMPVVQRVFECSCRLDLRILSDEDHLNLLDELVDDLELESDLNDMDLPLLLVFDEGWQFQGQWGPRPQAVEARLDQWLDEHPSYMELAESEDEDDQETYAALLENLTREMRVWYNSGMDSQCVAELRTLLASLQDDEEGELQPDEE